MTARTRALLALLFLSTAILGLAPALQSLGRLSQHYDWRYFEALSEIARRSVVWYGQAPLWNPYSCGGEVDWANPQSLSSAPTFLLVLGFGTAAGLKLSLLVYYVLGLHGAFCLGRRLGLSATGAALAALGFGLSGYQALHLSAGHMNFAGVCLYPYLIYCYDRSLDELEWALPAGLCAAWVTALGGTFTPPMAGLLLLLWAGGACLGRRSLRPLLPLLAIVAAALLSGAARSLPVLQFISDHPRPPFRRRVVDISLPWQVIADLFAWRAFAPVPGRQYYAHEYAAKLPWVLAPLWLAAVATRWRSAAARGLLGLSLFALLLSMGHFSPVAPWPLLQHLPVLRDLRVPSRFELILVLATALLAGLGWDGLAERLRPRLGERGDRILAALGALLVLVAAAEGVAYTAASFRGGFTAKVASPRRPVPFYFIQGHWSTFREDVLSGRGTLGCDEEAPLQRAEALDVGDVPQERLLDPTAGTVVDARWSPNRREVTVELQRGTTLLLNSNWNEHFRAEPAAVKVSKVAGRLAVDLSALPPGRHAITVRYAPRAFFLGVAISALSLPLGLLLFVRARRRRGAS